MASEGEHKGAAPKSERNTQDPVAERVHDLLTEEPWLDATDIDIAVSGGVVTLTGSAPTAEQVALAGKTAAEAEGVTEVKNELAVNINEGNSGVAEMNRIRSITDGRG
jgi:osmotically-inducible protein OsmY